MEEEEGGRRVIRTAGSLVWSQKAKEDDEKNGEIGENEEGEVGKRLRRVGHVRQSAGRLHPVGERLRPLTGPTGSRRSESDHHSSFMLPRDCHCTGPSGKRVPRQTLQCLFFTKYCLFGSLFGHLAANIEYLLETGKT